ncbi:hypothetical protein CORC01_01986 [Colletotrichum orchidophilum]|uniref:Uncharacterized protein n=1 Tax=Colletotrichum orchidophilum TaxID=1209926 RepID=A0A1G4BM98_9PEZI|nr:uncharacterized protein CORC01_01986 [Colletotrichum orchidophilum]OHF02590.1 hypothetical protein CORC01_01986 [Colletotrichum orchidophilum]
MPRPKRARRAPTQPVAAAAEVRSSPAPASGSDIYSHSDREHSVIRKELEQGDGSGDTSLFQEGPSTRLSRSSSLRQRQVLDKAGHAWDETTSKLEDAVETAASKAKTSSEQQKSDSSVELGRKTRATPVQQRRDTTGLDLDDEMFTGLDTTLGDDEDDAAAPPSAPRSEASTFSVSHFRRRGRAPSISINKDDAPIRPSSRGVGGTPSISSTFNIGLFKRRQREPSILGTAQKERAQRPIELSSGSESDEDGEDFEPEAESTPLQNRRRTQPPPATELESESQQVLAPDSQPTEKDAEPTSASSRKRKSIESHEATERPGKASRTESEPAPELDDDDDSDSELSELPSPVLTPTRPSAFPRPVTPNQDDIMAPPESSDSEDNNEAWPDIRTLAKQRRRQAPATPTRDGNISDASSPPSLTHSPNFPATRNKSKQKKQVKAPKVTTADLTGLLPRRRAKKNRDPYGMDDSEDEDAHNSDTAQDDDELSYADTRTRSRRAKATPLNRSTANRPPSRGGRAAAAAGKPKATPPSTRASTRTYSRRLSDKENEGEGEGEGEGEDETESAEAEAGAEPEAGFEGDSFAPIRDDVPESQESSDPARSADELKKATRKFKEVDRWELEFEEVTEGSSPQRDAR